MATVTEIVRASRRARRATEKTREASAERDQLIAEAHKQGESPKVLAQAAELSENQIFKIVRAARAGRSDG
jgi:Mor family transcriptional regulator